MKLISLTAALVPCHALQHYCRKNHVTYCYIVCLEFAIVCQPSVSQILCAGGGEQCWTEVSTSVDETVYFSSGCLVSPPPSEQHITLAAVVALSSVSGLTQQMLESHITSLSVYQQLSSQELVGLHRWSRYRWKCLCETGSKQHSSLCSLIAFS